MKRLQAIYRLLTARQYSILTSRDGGANWKVCTNANDWVSFIFPNSKNGLVKAHNRLFDMIRSLNHKSKYHK